MKNVLYILCVMLMLPGVVSAKSKVKQKEKTQAEIVQEQELKYYFYQAVQMFDQNQYADAMALFMHCEMVDPKDAATAHYLAILYGGRGMDEQAMVYTRKAYDLAPDVYWDYYASVLYQSGNRKQAIQVVEKEVKRNPDNKEALQMLQTMYKRMGNAQQALKVQDKIDKVSGMDIYGAMERYQIYRSMGKTKQAVQTLEDYLKKEPDDYYIQVILGDVLYRLGDKDKAYQQYTAIERDYPENPYLPMSLSTFWGDQGDTAKAADYIWQIVEGDNMNVEYKLDILDDCEWLTEEEKGRAWEFIAEQFPQEELALVKLEKYYKSQNRVNETHELCKSIVSLNPDNKDAWMDMMWTTLYDSTSTFARNDSVIREVMSHMTDEDAVNRLMIHASYGDLLMREYQNDTTQKALCDSAFINYEAALRIDPENTIILNNYAYFLAITGGDLRKAEKMSQVSIRKEPHNATFLDTYAWILHLQGEDMLSKLYIKQAMTYAEDKEDPDLVEHYRIITNE